MYACKYAYCALGMWANSKLKTNVQYVPTRLDFPNTLKESYNSFNCISTCIFFSFLRLHACNVVYLKGVSKCTFHLKNGRLKKKCMGGPISRIVE